LGFSGAVGEVWARAVPVVAAIKAAVSVAAMAPAANAVRVKVMGFL
jgi:hypothetical protein